MRVPAVALVLVVLCGAARAQETQQDLAERLYREQQDIRARATAKVAGAPDRAMGFAGATSFDPAAGMPQSGAVAAMPVKSKSAKGFPWAIAGWSVGGLIVVIWAWTTWSKSGRPAPSKEKWSDPRAWRPPK